MLGMHYRKKNSVENSGENLCFNPEGLKIAAPPKFHRTGESVYEVVEHESVTLDCAVATEPKPEVIWYRGEQPLYLAGNMALSPDAMVSQQISWFSNSLDENWYPSICCHSALATHVHKARSSFSEKEDLKSSNVETVRDQFSLQICYSCFHMFLRIHVFCSATYHSLCISL